MKSTSISLERAKQIAEKSGDMVLTGEACDLAARYLACLVLIEKQAVQIGRLTGGEIVSGDFSIHDDIESQAEQIKSTPNCLIRDNFLDEIVQAASLPNDPPGPCWARWIDRVDMSDTTGYAFEGDFIGSGTVEIEIGRSRLILAQVGIRDKGRRGTWHQLGYTRQFRVITMNPFGTLTPTYIATDDRRGGWALRIRGLTANLLKEIRERENPGESRFSNVQV